jgi:uncharacterized protein (TIGR00369 family)
VTTTPNRRGPFWDAVDGRAPAPPAAVSLGLKVLDADETTGRVKLSFEAQEAFTTPTGDVLGGYLAAMLYDTVGPALLATLEPDQFIDTLDMQVTFVGQTRPGRLIGHGRVLRRDGDIAILEAELETDDGRPLAAARSVIRVVPGPGRRQ